MQLILETEPNIDIKKDMAMLNEPLDEKLITNGISEEEPKTDMLKMNKERLQSQDDVIVGAEATTGDDKMAEESLIEEIKKDLKNQEKNNIPMEKITSPCSSEENFDTNLTRIEDNAVENGSTNNKDEKRQEDKELQSENISGNVDICEEKNVNQVEPDTEPATHVDRHLTSTKDNTIESGLTDNKDEKRQEEEELQSKNVYVNEDICEENNIKQKCNENDEKPAKYCKVEEFENDVGDESGVHTNIQVRKESSEEDAENITSSKEVKESKVLDDFDIDEESNPGGEIDYLKIENELNMDEERNVASVDASSVNQENCNSVNNVIDAKEVNVLDGPRENEDSKMEIYETSGMSPCANDQCLSNDGTESGYVTAIPSVDDQQKSTVKETLSDKESEFPLSDYPKNNLEKDTMETDDTTQTSSTDESNKTAVIVLGKAIDDDKKETIESCDITQMPLNNELKKTTVERIDHEDKGPGDITQKVIDMDNNVKDLDHENKEFSVITKTLLTDEFKMTIAGLRDKAMIFDDNSQNVDQEKMELEEIAQIPLADTSKNMDADLTEKVIDIGDNIKDHDQKSNELVKDTALIKEVKTTHVKEKVEVKKSSLVVSKLSNTLDILSDDEDEPPKITEKMESQLKESSSNNKCINIEDDDDIMLIDEDTDSKDSKTESCDSVPAKTQASTSDMELKETVNKSDVTVSETVEHISVNTNKESKHDVTDIIEQPQLNEKANEQLHKTNTLKPLLPENFLKSAKKNLVDMTRDDLEEFCILKIVESVVDRSNLNEIKTKLKILTQNVKEYSNKAKMLTKQNRDLQVVMKSIQEEQKKNTDTPIAPLKITRSVGMQVFMMDKVIPRKKGVLGTNTAQTNINIANKQSKTTNPSQRIPRQVQVNNQNQTIPVPRLIPAIQNNATAKAPANQAPTISNQLKTSSPISNGTKIAPAAQKSTEKRPHNRVQSVTVDLTDDEPPTKVPTRSAPAQPVRVVPSQNLMAPQRPQLSQNNSSSPRKVYIPISGPQGQNLRPGHFMLKTVSPSSGPRPRGPTAQLTRMPQNQIRVQRLQSSRHPAPLPDAMKQYQPPNWKSLPPAPDIKLSKVENGIVISWKIDGYLEDVHEEIASYQLYAYQETPSPPSTALWKKIGDVKALPLPMACTLTQFMAGFKYFFAVRAVDVRSRLGPFSMPGSILLLNKM